MSYKVCVYAICKNEERFVDGWISVFLDKADYICILDTGSTDSTVEKLKSYGSKVIVNQKFYKNFRFDVARNDSMLFIPEDTDICIKADFDQIWTPSWHDLITKAFSEGYNEISGPILNYDEKGNLIDTTISGDVHFYSKDWNWVYPVHEQRIYNGSLSEKNIYLDDLIIEHRPDTHKGRNYDSIIENWYNEDKKKYSTKDGSAYCALYYGNQICRSNSEQGLKIYEEALQGCSFSEKDPMFSQLCINISHYKDNLAAISYLEKAFTSGFITRNLCNLLAERYEDLDPEKAVYYYEYALSIPQVRFWAEDERLFNQGIIENKLSLLFYYKIKDYKKAYFWGQEALKATDATFYQKDIYIKNLEYFKEKLSEYKVCVYAICKNESSNIEKWAFHIKDADLVVVLDTGSTDNSFNILKSIEEKNSNFHLSQKIYSDFSFATARNDCLSYARTFIEDSSWIFIWLDIDEFPREGFFSEIKRNWTSNLDGLYVLGVSFDDCFYWSMKCHSSNFLWYWKFIIHEQPYLQGREFEVSEYKTLRLDSAIYDHKTENAYTSDKDIFFLEKQKLYYTLNKKQHTETPTEILIFYNLIWDCDNLGLLEEKENYYDELYTLLVLNKYSYIPRVNYNNVSIPVEIKLKTFIHKIQSCTDLIKKERYILEVLKIIYSKEVPETRQLYSIFGDYYFKLDNKNAALFFYTKALSIKEDPKDISSWCLPPLPTEIEIYDKIEQIFNLDNVSFKPYIPGGLL